MGYMLPLRFIEVSSEPAVSICATRIVAMMSTKNYQARRTIYNEKKSGTLINACGNKAAKTAIFLDNGAVVSSPKTISVLMTAVEKSNMKANAKSSVRMKIYDVYDEDPTEETDEEEEVMSDYGIDDEEFDEELDDEFEDFDDE